MKPTSKQELIEIIEETIYKKGNKCDLNFIDVSLITDMGYLFHEIDFKGDISKWNVSNVVNMNGMFNSSTFNGDISKWNVSNVKYMGCTFSDCPLEKIHLNGIEVKSI